MRNREILDRAFEKLRDGLHPFVLRELKAVYGDGWPVTIEPYTRRRSYQASKPGDEVSLDVSALLGILLGRWKEVFERKLDPLARGYASELRAVRNKFAHPLHDEEFPSEDTDRALDTMMRLLKLVSAATEEDAVRYLREQIGRPAASAVPRVPRQPAPARPMLSAADVAEAVRAFDDRYGDMEQVLWCLSKAARKDLLRGRSSAVVETLVWTIKSWWGVQGVTRQIKVAAAQALAAETWSEQLFDGTPQFTLEAEGFACERVSALVSALQTLGATRRQEFSLASKVLHWLLPWRVPIYDSFVRRSLNISSSREAKDAYSALVNWEYDVVRRLSATSTEWLGAIEPKSPFRAIDKYLWWLAGGPSQQAVIVRDPWKVVRGLGISPCQ